MPKCLRKSYIIMIPHFSYFTRYMKYLYPYECEKKHFSTPSELQAAIDGNRREGRRTSYGQFESQMQQQLQMVKLFFWKENIFETNFFQYVRSHKCRDRQFQILSSKCHRCHWLHTQIHKTDLWVLLRWHSCQTWVHTRSNRECLSILSFSKLQKTSRVSFLRDLKFSFINFLCIRTTKSRSLTWSS